MKKAILVIILGVINTIYAFASLLDMWISQLVDPSQVFDDYGYDFNGSDTLTVWLISGIIILVCIKMLRKKVLIIKNLTKINFLVFSFNITKLWYNPVFDTYILKNS